VYPGLFFSGHDVVTTNYTLTITKLTITTITITAKSSTVLPTALDGSASQAEKAEPKIQHKLQSK